MVDTLDIEQHTSGALAALTRLERMCCAPERSPRLAAISDAVISIRDRASSVDAPGAAESLLAESEETGAALGRLQVACCAPARMPLYADVLSALTEIQRATNQHIGRGH